MIYVIAIRMSPLDSDRYEHITDIRWERSDRTKGGTLTRQAAIDWLQRDPGNRLWVEGPISDAEVLVVDANPPYLRSDPDGVWSNNLLSLPRF